MSEIPVTATTPELEVQQPTSVEETKGESNPQKFEVAEGAMGSTLSDLEEALGPEAYEKFEFMTVQNAGLMLDQANKDAEKKAQERKANL